MGDYYWSMDDPADYNWRDYKLTEHDLPATDIGEQHGPLHDLDMLLAGGERQQRQRQQQDNDRFCFGGVASLLPPAPELSIDGYGPVSLPLIDAKDAHRLAQVCQQAPFGRGTDTLVDTAVRKTWQLDPEKFLFYEAGGHFGKHRDTEKEDGMFATLVVQLPSAHKGGELVIYKDGQPVAHDFGASAGSSAGRCHYAVHYADAEHEVTPVTQGYRLALVYSVCWPKDRPRDEVPAQPADSAQGEDELSAALGTLSDQEKHFMHFLSHDYTIKSVGDLGAAALKGVDRDRMGRLLAANALMPADRRYAFYITQATRQTDYVLNDDCDGWEEEAPPDVDFSHLQVLEGDGRITGRKSPAGCFGKRDVLNPDRKSLLGLWRGHRKTKSGRSLLKEKPSDRQLEDFLAMLKSFYPTKAAAPGFYAIYEDLRHVLFDVIAARPFNQRLFDLYMDVHPTAKLLFESKDGWEDLLRLLNWPEAWQSARDRVRVAFAGDARLAIKALDKSLKEGADELIPVLSDALVRTEEPVKAGRYDSFFDDNMWKAAFLAPDEAVCRNIVQRQLNTPADDLWAMSTVRSLERAKRNGPEQFEARQHIVRPVVERCVTALKRRRDKRAAPMSADDYWRFDKADFCDNQEVQRFLRGPERTTRLEGLGSITAARRVVREIRDILPDDVAQDAAKFSRYLMGFDCSFTAEAGGSGKDAYVTLTKTDVWPQKREEYRQRDVELYDRNVARAVALLAEGDAASADSGSGSGSDDGNGQVQKGGGSDASATRKALEPLQEVDHRPTSASGSGSGSEAAQGGKATTKTASESGKQSRGEGDELDDGPPAKRTRTRTRRSAA
ncbi:uncharacterized protein PFL1_06945 [Pseudozyma flocculosa PF-1]|uniref:Fe2OG dioxygenase domain-containing protein n=1 Tax=Pseudozyma flocculosa PF-1 TaxID=1277687 RepID=A0A061H3A1_9BASI|nr:uncharacterized protein PFL1_06945 [Pseudozyma flocculosa PF-1]EPQ26340.1 hypothetical protein PFL1_06945 [Pseudozyma flocculosa PF-1]